MGMIEGLVSYVRCGELNLRGQREDRETGSRCRGQVRDSWADQIIGKGVYMVENGIT